MVKLHLQAFWQNFEYGKMQSLVAVYQTFKNLLLRNRILRYRTQIYSPWVCLIEVCSNGGATYIITEIIAKNILNIVRKSSSPKLLDRILRYCTQMVFGYI